MCLAWLDPEEAYDDSYAILTIIVATVAIGASVGMVFIFGKGAREFGSFGLGLLGIGVSFVGSALWIFFGIFTGLNPGMITLVIFLLVGGVAASAVYKFFKGSE